MNAKIRVHALQKQARFERLADDGRLTTAFPSWRMADSSPLFDNRPRPHVTSISSVMFARPTVVEVR